MLGFWGGPLPSPVHLQYPLGDVLVGSEEAQIKYGVTVYILKQLKRIIINIFVVAKFVCSKGDSVDKEIDLENVGPSQ